MSETTRTKLLESELSLLMLSYSVSYGKYFSIELAEMFKDRLRAIDVDSDDLYADVACQFIWSAIPGGETAIVATISAFKAINRIEEIPRNWR